MNVCPVGRSCSQAERDQFVAFERAHPIRERFVAALRERFPAETCGLTFSIGGQISIGQKGKGKKSGIFRKFLKREQKVRKKIFAKNP